MAFSEVVFSSELDTAVRNWIQRKEGGANAWGVCILNKPFFSYLRGEGKYVS